MEYERPTNLFFRFEELRIYNKALNYVSWVYSNSQMFPDSEKRGITAKYIASAQSIAINIAEGSGRNKMQFIYFLKLAKSYIRECVVLTTICRRLEFLSDTDVEESRTFLVEMTRMLNALINSLQRNERQQERQGNIDDYEVLSPDTGNLI